MVEQFVSKEEFIKKDMRLNLTTLFLCFLVALSWSPSEMSADVPPVWQNQQAKMRKDVLTQTYVAPRSIVWMNGKGTLVKGEQQLLQLGSGQAEMSHQERCCQMTTTDKDTASILLDYGRELQGGLRLLMASGSRPQPSLVRIRFGESVQECFSTTRNEGCTVGYSCDDHAKRDMVLEIPRDGQIQVGNTGFRFVRIDLLQPNATIALREAAAVFRYRDVPYVGSFHCSDSRLDSIWMTGAYTVHLNMQEYLWDGIKRDRLVWLGDMHPEISTISAVFGYNDVVPSTLDLACQQYPLPDWLNGMTSYSMWYLIIQHDWYMQNGDKAFLNRHRNYILGLVDLFDKAVDSQGQVQGNFFLDWPSSPDAEGVRQGVHALLVWAMKDTQKLCRLWKDEDHARTCGAIIDRVEKHLSSPQSLKQAAALMAISGQMTPQKAYADYLSKGGQAGFSTFYGYYMLEAEAMAGKYKEAMDVIRSFWGGMLDMGATTFWEDYQPQWAQNANRIDEVGSPDKKNIHGDYGDYCYKGFRLSLCHGWASGPTAWLSRYVLGIQIEEPGCKTLRLSPHLGDLQYAEGTYPTPYGPVSVRHERLADGSIRSKVGKPRQVRIVTDLKQCTITNIN
jgi:alpha-L-rhamnosidase